MGHEEAYLGCVAAEYEKCDQVQLDGCPSALEPGAYID